MKLHSLSGLRLWTGIILLGSICHLKAADAPDLSSVPPDLTMPPVTTGPPEPGKRVPRPLLGWLPESGEPIEAYHLIYLPTNWQRGKTYPVLVEYAGNGGYTNAYGDTSDGTVEGSQLGYGISGGKDFIWLSLPFIERVPEDNRTPPRWRNATRWWGDVEQTKRYCLAAIKETCGLYGGDPKNLILCGFSRGSIACNYIGLHDDEIAKLWRAFICHSHYDGVNESWPYPAADRASALTRLKRLNGRPQFITHELTIQPIEAYLQSTHLPGNWTLLPIPFRNHSNAWPLRALPERQKLREWLAKTIHK